METEYNEIMKNLSCYERILSKIQEIDKDIKFLGLEGITVGFEKNGKHFNQSLITWQCAADPDRPDITEEKVANWVLESMKNY